jgi:hypothetical protein
VKIITAELEKFPKWGGRLGLVLPDKVDPQRE